MRSATDQPWDFGAAVVALGSCFGRAKQRGVDDEGKACQFNWGSFMCLPHCVAIGHILPLVQCSIPGTFPVVHCHVTKSCDEFVTQFSKTM